MTTDTFSASTQYGDLRGTAMADRADHESAGRWLENQGLKSEDEFIVGIEMFVGENHGSHNDPIYIKFLISSERAGQLIGTADHPAQVRAERVNMNVVDFLALFKRLSVTLSPEGDLEGKHFTHED